MIHVLVNGCNGRMGKEVVLQVQASSDMEVIGGMDTMLNPDYSFPVYTDTSKIEQKPDVIIDFSIPVATRHILQYALETKTPLVIATTGLSDEDLAKIEEASRIIPIFRAANMSYEINLMKKLASFLAKALPNADIEIVETHHNRKIDAPSGTALSIADAVNEARNQEMEYVYTRADRRESRSKKEIGISAVRGGNIVGEHSIQFFSPFDTLEIKHTSYSRNVFAEGALQAARFLIAKQAGLYNMDHLANAVDNAMNEK